MQKQWLKIIVLLLILALCLPATMPARPKNKKTAIHQNQKYKQTKKTTAKKKNVTKNKNVKKKAVIKKKKKKGPKLIVAFRRRMVVTAFMPRHSNGRRRHIGGGKYAGKGSVAVSYRQIPKGSKMYIQGYGWGRAVSTGGAMRKDRIDICLPTLKACRKWGRRTVWVTVYKIKR